MSQKFTPYVQRGQDGRTFIKLSGVIDEDNELAELSAEIPSGTEELWIDLGEVERINSCGVRDWVNWLSHIESKTGKVLLVRCSPAIVAQINLVNNFTGNGIVGSFYVPYFCPECDEEKVLLCETHEMGPPPHDPPTCRCDECDLVMDFDDMPDSYFAFLSNQQNNLSPSNVEAGLVEFDGGDGERSRMRGRVGASLSSSSPPPPSVPSLPPIQTPGPMSVGWRVGDSWGSPSPSQPDFGIAGPSPLPNLALSGDRPPVVPPKGGAVIYLLLGVLLAAVGVLAFLLFAAR